MKYYQNTARSIEDTQLERPSRVHVVYSANGFSPKMTSGQVTVGT